MGNGSALLLMLSFVCDQLDNREEPPGHHLLSRAAIAGDAVCWAWPGSLGRSA